MEVKVLEGQSLFDLAIQACGSVESVFDFAQRNVICITDLLLPGHTVQPPDVKYKGIVNYFSELDITPASETDVKKDRNTFDNTFDLTFR